MSLFPWIELAFDPAPLPPPIEPEPPAPAPDPDDKKDGLAGAIGFDPPVDRFLVAIAVGNTHDGESLPAKPNLVKPVPLSITTAGVFMLDIVALVVVVVVEVVVVAAGLRFGTES